MDRRPLLQTMLKNLLGSDNVYYQQPSKKFMRYPSIIYSIAKIKNVFANNQVYKQTRTYTITVIDYNPDSVIVNKISLLPDCSFDRHYVVDNLHHTVFTLYF